MTIGERIKELRLQKGYTQKELAQKCGYKSLTTINKLELNINNAPLSSIEKIAAALETTPAYLMGWTDDKNAEDTISPKKQQVLEMFESLNDDQLEQITDFMRFLIEKRTK